MQVFAIKHKPTGKWMPARLNKAPGGWSYWDPTDDAPAHDKNPRLFFTLRSAQNALTAWIMGEHRRESGTTYDWEGIPEGYDNHIIDEPKVPRSREQMEIVRMELRGAEA